LETFSHLKDFENYINIREGIGRIANNQKIYAKLMASFLKGDYAKQLRNDYECSDWAAASATAHTIKGVAANLSLTALYDQSVVLENELRDGQISLASVDLFCDIWDTTVEYVKEIVDFMANSPLPL